MSLFNSHMSGQIRSDAGRMVQLAWPVIVARLGIMTMALVDTIVVGQYSTAELARLSMAFPPVSMILVAGIGMLGGTSVMAARYQGNGQTQLIGGVWHRALGYALIFGVMGLPMGLFGRQILIALGQPAELIDGAAAVLLVLALGMPFHLIYVASAQLMEGLSRPMPGMVMMLAANVLNLILNLVLVAGWGGLPGFGALGTAWATTGSRLALALGLSAYIWYLDGHQAMGIRRIGTASSNPYAGAEQLRLGLANGASLTVEQFAFVSMSVLAGWLGANALAAYSLTINFLAIVFMVALGLGVAAAVMVSEAYGRRHFHDVRRIGFVAIALNIGLMGIAAIITFGMPHTLAALYAGDPVLVDIAAPLILLAGLAVIFDGTQTVASQVLRARGEAWMPTLSHILSYVGVMVPLAYWLVFTMNHGVDGLMESIIIASILSSGLLVLRFGYLSWRERGWAISANLSTNPHHH